MAGASRIKKKTTKKRTIKKKVAVKKIRKTVKRIVAKRSFEDSTSGQTGMMSRAELTAYRRARKELYAAAYMELCERVTGKPPAKKLPAESRFIKQVIKYFKGSSGNEPNDFYKIICIKFNYCERMKAWETTINVTRGILALAAILAELVSCGILTALWMITSPLLSELCECKKRQPS